MAPVKIHCDIQQVDFQLLTHTGNGWARADIGYARERLRPQTINFYRINPFHRGNQALQRQVGGREADGATQLIAVHHPTRNAVRVAQQRLRLRQVVIAQRIADRRAADALIALAEGRRADHFKAVFFPGFLQ
ncbi:hypothetical protein D3C79_853650 [compost metagenome]